ncbi:CPBP family intramembrane glutamic endopeptidase [Kribbella solani]|uniref:CPBP family intramembrane glutamic endopeptidase n=1 Tax=Kribbella solani TaxID=236067 RepID=UPI0029A5741B|nr:CPBP family intramembrane glutamic endopeptidase [Kribbella solani]MDX2971566.1 CPBP family intramembrane metalloprotease [Kribbella solani]
MDPQQPGPPSQPGPYPQQPGSYPPPGPPGPYVQPYPQPHSQQYPGPYPQPWGAPPSYPGQFGYREPRIIPAPEGTPYHRLGRTPKHAWWRPVVGTLLLGALTLLLTGFVAVAWVVVHRVFIGPLPAASGTVRFSSETENLALNLALLGVLTPAVGLTAWLVQRRPFWSVASVLNRIRWRWLLWCCLPGLGYILLTYLMGILVDAVFPSNDAIGQDGGSWVGLGAFIAPALVIIALVPFQSAAEEFVFRGWLLQALGAYGPDQPHGRIRWLRTIFRTPWPGIVIGGLAFVSAHGYTGWAMADVFLFAVVVGWLTVRTGGLESGIALHALNNLSAFLLPAAMGQLSGWDEQGGAPWTLLVSDIPCLAFYAFAVLWLAKRKRVATVS